MGNGMVYLVGAGPGDPDLITVRGLQALQQADVVVYDRLISPDLVAQARPDATLIFAGKERGCHWLSQDEINRLLVRLGQEGRVVCRLKGGDPFIFGRGGEEALALAEAGVPFAVVPGVSSAVAAPAFAGIPVTHRGVAHAFTVVTGHLQVGDDAAGGIDWEALARAGGTLVILMGMSNLPELSARLVAGGRGPETPTAVIERGTWASQRVLRGTLGSIAQQVQEAGIAAPAAVVVGEVVRLGEALDWFRPDRAPVAPVAAGAGSAGR